MMFLGKFNRLLLLLVSAACLLGFSAPTEYQLKAVFIHKLLKFVEWPEHGFSDGKTVVIGVLGNAELANELDSFRQKQGVSTLKIVSLNDFKEANNINVLFVGASHQSAKLMRSIKDLKCLTIGESEDFSRFGGMVNLLIKSDRLTFELNLQALKDANYTVNSRVLKAAETIW